MLSFQTLTSLSQRAPPAPVSRAFPALPTWPCTHSHWQHFPRACSDQSVQWPVCPRLFHRGVWTVRRTGSKLRTFGLYHTTNWKCSPFDAPVVQLLFSRRKRRVVPVLDCPIVDCGRRWRGGFYPALRRPPAAQSSCPADLSRQTEAGVTNPPPPKPPQATKPPTQNQPHALFSLETQMKLEIL